MKRLPFKIIHFISHRWALYEALWEQQHRTGSDELWDTTARIALVSIRNGIFMLGWPS